MPSALKEVPKPYHRAGKIAFFLHDEHSLNQLLRYSHQLPFYCGTSIHSQVDISYHSRLGTFFLLGAEPWIMVPRDGAARNR